MVEGDKGRRAVALRRPQLECGAKEVGGEFADKAVALSEEHHVDSREYRDLESEG